MYKRQIVHHAELGSVAVGEDREVQARSVLFGQASHDHPGAPALRPTGKLRQPRDDGPDEIGLGDVLVRCADPLPFGQCVGICLLYTSRCV